MAQQKEQIDLLKELLQRQLNSRARGFLMNCHDLFLLLIRDGVDCMSREVPLNFPSEPNDQGANWCRAKIAIVRGGVGVGFMCAFVAGWVSRGMLREVLGGECRCESGVREEREWVERAKTEANDDDMED